MADLKPCPFCGGAPTQIFSINPETDGRYIYGCCTIGCMGNALRGRGGFKTDKEAIEAWNRRADNGIVDASHDG